MTDVKSIFKALATMTNEELVKVAQESNIEAVKKKAVERIVIKNRGLVRRVAHAYPIYNTEFENREQDGMIGLLTAINKFDDNQKVQFSTYAWTWIKQAIIEEGNEAGNVIRVPRHVAEARMKVNKVRNRFMKEEGRFPSIEEMVKLCKTVKKDLVEYIIAGQGTVSGSIDAPVSAGDEALSAHDIHGGPELIAGMVGEHNMQLLVKAIATMHPNEQFMLNAVFGLTEDHEAYNFSELVGCVERADGATLNNVTSVSRQYHALVKVLIDRIDDERIKAYHAPKKVELTFETLLARTTPSVLMREINKLHYNEQFIIQAHNGLLEDDDESWSLEDMVGNVFDSQETPLETVSQVRAEYKSLLRWLERQILDQ
ncbi:RNA polymerase sigma-70 region 2 [Vibrio phage 2.275.O._10N.286.54.E11]|nr:RNA polymerase sigma-70 region 2 [Vibrio phage 2.275.O._10N.286.54.E11]